MRLGDYNSSSRKYNDGFPGPLSDMRIRGRCLFRAFVLQSFLYHFKIIPQLFLVWCLQIVLNATSGKCHP